MDMTVGGGGGGPWPWRRRTARGRKPIWDQSTVTTTVTR